MNHATSSSYKTYLKSQHWQHVRQEAFDRLGRKCGACHGTSQLNVHHVRYYRDGRSILYHEQPDDVAVLCSPCHQSLHRVGRLDSRRYDFLNRALVHGGWNHLQVELDGYKKVKSSRKASRKSKKKAVVKQTKMTPDQKRRLKEVEQTRRANEMSTIKQLRKNKTYNPILGTWSSKPITT